MGRAKGNQERIVHTRTGNSGSLGIKEQWKEILPEPGENQF